MTKAQTIVHLDNGGVTVFHRPVLVAREGLSVLSGGTSHGIYSGYF